MTLYQRLNDQLVFLCDPAVPSVIYRVTALSIWTFVQVPAEWASNCRIPEEKKERYWVGKCDGHTSSTRYVACNLTISVQAFVASIFTTDIDDLRARRRVRLHL